MHLANAALNDLAYNWLSMTCKKLLAKHLEPILLCLIVYKTGEFLNDQVYSVLNLHRFKFNVEEVG